MKALETRAQVEIKNVLFPTDFSREADAAIPIRSGDCAALRRSIARLAREAASH